MIGLRGSFQYLTLILYILRNGCSSLAQEETDYSFL